MNPKNFQLIASLRENSREKLTKVSKKTNIPISTLFDLLRELQENRFITKSTVLLNFSGLGYHAHAQVFLKVRKEVNSGKETEKELKEKLKTHLYCHPNVNTLYKVNNSWDFIIETVHRNIKELDSFLEELSTKYALEEKEIHYLVDEVKREGFMLGSE